MKATKPHWWFVHGKKEGDGEFKCQQCGEYCFDPLDDGDTDCTKYNEPEPQTEEDINGRAS